MNRLARRCRLTAGLIRNVRLTIMTVSPFPFTDATRRCRPEVAVVDQARAVCVSPRKTIPRKLVRGRRTDSTPYWSTRYVAGWPPPNIPR
jgi:hypothetical protein